MAKLLSKVNALGLNVISFGGCAFVALVVLPAGKKAWSAIACCGRILG